MAKKRGAYSFFWAALMAFLGGALFISCPQPSGNGIEAPESSDDGLTYVKFINNSQFDADVYLDNPQQDKTVFARVPAGSNDVRKKILPSGDTGTPFYIVYRINIGSVTIPYFDTDYIKNQKFEEEKITPLVISQLTSSVTGSFFLVIQNDSAESIWLQQDSATLYAIGQEETEDKKWIAPQEDGVYEFASPINLNQISIIDNIKKVTLPVINSEKERIYTLRYDGKTAALFSIAPFNLDIINKIWSIPTSDSFGSFFAVGFFAPRKNPQDGYVLTGNIFPDQEAWRDSVDVNRPSWLFSPGLPYFSAITQNGEIANEKIIRVRDNPEEIYFTSFLEESPEELIFIGSSYYAGTEREKTFLLSMSADGASTNYYYTDFVNDIDEDQYDLWNGGVIVSRGPEKYGLGMTLFERETNLAKIYVVNVDKTGFNAVQHSKLWESPPPDDISFIDMIYDSAHNMYVILGRKWEAGTEIETGSVIFFIDAVTGNAKFSPISQNRFFLNKILKVGGDYYVGGSYDSDSGAFEGILHKILPGAGQFDWSAPVRFFSDDKNGSLSIKNLLEDDKGNLILAGLTNAKPDGWSYLPWLCAFNPGRKEIIWQNVYREIPYNQDESLNNYEIYSVYPNGIGSYLIEIYNGYSGHSFLLSTDMTGKMSNKELPPVPRNLNYYPSVLSYPILGSKAKKNPQ